MSCDGESMKRSRCNVKYCKKYPFASTHRLPHKKFFKLRQMWLDKLQLDSDFNGNFYVCGNHFVDTDFRPGCDKKHLIHFAVPSVNLPPKKVKLSAGYSIEPFDDNETADEGIILSGDPLAYDELKIEILDQDYGEFISEEETDCSRANEFAAVEYHDKMIKTESTTTSETNTTVVTNYKTDCSRANELATVKYHDKMIKTESTTTSETNTTVVTNDKSIQTNLAYDELLKPWTLMDCLRTNSDLQSWTGIQRFATLDDIVERMKRLECVQVPLSKFRTSPKLLTVFTLAKLKTNLSFKQLSCLFSLTPQTLRRHFDGFVPILRAVLEPAVFWLTKEEVYSNQPRSFASQFEDFVVDSDCKETPIPCLEELEHKNGTCEEHPDGETNISSILVGNVLRAYEVKASDKYIVLMKKSIGKKMTGVTGGVKLYRPAILDQPEHTKKEVIFFTNVGSSKTQDERVIARIRMFDAFNDKMDKSITKHSDDAVVILCAITNFNSS